MKAVVPTQSKKMTDASVVYAKCMAAATGVK
jgi:hypothetical protein